MRLQIGSRWLLKEGLKNLEWKGVMKNRVLKTWEMKRTWCCYRLSLSGNCCCHWEAKSQWTDPQSRGWGRKCLWNCHLRPAMGKFWMISSQWKSNGWKLQWLSLFQNHTNQIKNIGWFEYLIWNVLFKTSYVNVMNLKLSKTRLHHKLVRTY